MYKSDLKIFKEQLGEKLCEALSPWGDDLDKMKACLVLGADVNDPKVINSMNVAICEIARNPETTYQKVKLMTAYGADMNKIGGKAPFYTWYQNALDSLSACAPPDNGYAYRDDTKKYIHDTMELIMEHGGKCSNQELRDEIVKRLINMYNIMTLNEFLQLEKKGEKYLREHPNLTTRQDEVIADSWLRRRSMRSDLRGTKNPESRSKLLEMLTKGTPERNRKANEILDKRYQERVRKITR